MEERNMEEHRTELMIVLTEDELEAVSGGAGSATFTFSNTASGTTASVGGTLTIRTTASSASLSGSFSSSAT
jgi:bacteriocin-like protein